MGILYSMEQELNDLIDYCYQQAEESDGSETGHDIYCSIARDIQAILEKQKVGFASESSMLDGM